MPMRNLLKSSWFVLKAVMFLLSKPSFYLPPFSPAFINATFTIRFAKLSQQETGWFGGDRFGMLAPMAQCDVPAAAISANTVAIRNVSREQGGSQRND